jgi:hypothetical protein
VKRTSNRDEKSAFKSSLTAEKKKEFTHPPGSKCKKKRE